MEREDPEFTSTWGHTETSTTCVTAHSENNLKPKKTDLPELKTSREGISRSAERAEMKSGTKPSAWQSTSRKDITGMEE